MLILLDQLIGTDRPVTKVDATRGDALSGFFHLVTTGLKLIRPFLENYPALVIPAFFIWLYVLTKRWSKHPIFDASVFALFSFSAFNIILIVMTFYEALLDNRPSGPLSFLLYAAHMALHLKGTYRQTLLRSAGGALLVVLLGFLTIVVCAALIGLVAERLH